MEAVSVVIAETPAQVEVVRRLCRESVEDQLATYPAFRGPIASYFGSSRWERTLADLPEIHARPQGAMLIAYAGTTPVGCIMSFGAAPGTAEIKRLFVSPRARGCGVARTLVAALLAQIRADGYVVARLETAAFLELARALYRQFGFVEAPNFYDHPPEVAEISVAYRRDLRD